MSAVNRPNMNFDNERKEHVAYSKTISGSLQSAYERFRKPKNGKAKQRKPKTMKTEQANITTFNTWFK